MLNYIWLGLIVIAIFVAVGRDVSEETSDRFRNEQPVWLHVEAGTFKITDPNHYTGPTFLLKSEAAKFYGSDEMKNVIGDTILFAAQLFQFTSNPYPGTTPPPP